MCDVKFTQEIQLSDSDGCVWLRVRVCSCTRDVGVNMETNSELLTS